MDVGRFIGFIFLNFVVAASSLIFVLRFSDSSAKSLSKLFLSSFVIFCSQILIVEIVLGVFGLLFYKNVLVVVCVISMALLLLFGKKAFGNFKIIKPKFNLRRTFLAVLLFAPVGYLLTIRAFNATLQIPLEFDSVAYHLPFLVEWLKTGSLNDLYYSVFSGPISYYPSNYELFGLWFVMPFANDFFINLINFPLFVIFGVASYKVLERFNINKNIALFTTAILMLMPIFIRQSGVFLVDLFFTLAFVLAIFFLQEIFFAKKLKGVNYIDFLMFGLSVGFLIGTKYLGLVYAFFLVAVLVIGVLIKLKGNGLVYLKSIMLFVAGVLVTGSFFYIRNWLNSGNPIFPVTVNAFGANIFHGYLGTNETLATTSLWENLNDLANLKKFLKTYFFITGPFGIVSIFLPPLILIMVLIKGFFLKIFKKYFNKEHFWALAVLSFGACLYLFLYIKAPYSYKDLPQNIRYSMPFLFLGVSATACAFSYTKLLRYLFYTGSLLTLYFSVFYLILFPPELVLYGDRLLIDYGVVLKYSNLFLIFGVFVVSVFFVFMLILFEYRKKILTSSVFVIFCVISLWSGFYVVNNSYVERGRLSDYWAEFWFKSDQKFLDILEGVDWLERRAPGANVAYSGFNYSYHLLGSDFSREVDYININECAECRYIDYKDSTESVRRDPNYNNWTSNLMKFNKQYLIVSPTITPAVHIYEFEWAEAHPGKFKKVFRNNSIYIYEISYDS